MEGLEDEDGSANARPELDAAAAADAGVIKAAAFEAAGDTRSDELRAVGSLG